MANECIFYNIRNFYILDMRNIGSAIIETGDITPPCKFTREITSPNNCEQRTIIINFRNFYLLSWTTGS